VNPNDAVDCLRGGGEMGEMMRQIDWAKTPVGPVSGWSQAFRTTMGLVLRNGFPLCAWWGPELVQFYNDHFTPTLGDKHPRACAQSGRDCWAEIWHIIGPMIEGPFAGGPAAGAEELPLLIHRNGMFEETHFRVAYSPVPDETVPGTGIGGVLATVSETTAQVIAERQRRSLRELGVRAVDAKSVESACVNAAAVLGENSADAPFSLFYLLDGDTARLVAASGFVDGPHVSQPDTIDLASTTEPGLWPLANLIAQRQIQVVDCDDPRYGALPKGAWSAPPRLAILVPLTAPDQHRPYGIMISGLNPHRRLDDNYRSFFELAGAQVVTAIRNARSYEEERRHLEALAALDRQKTAFFSNVSHEFRTPLALMIGPTEDALASTGTLSGDALQMVHRNELRLLKLVNSLLDFSRMEAGRVEASFQATDLAKLTSDLASQFRSVMERGGLTLTVETPELSEPAFVDREMWEKIVLNLLSNAFKHTFEGGVTVRLATVGDHLELSVRDTGVGIAEDELPRVFDRFHRVRGTQSRSHEGTGIGLALTKDLVGLHGGRIRAASKVGVGTTITVSIPTGSAHLPADHIAGAKTLTSTAVDAAAFLNDAQSWLPPDAQHAVAIPAPVPLGSPIEADASIRIVLADDNADMREYLRGLLSAQWTVESVQDGQAALDAIRRQMPDLLVSDVMMPGIDGLELTRQVRADPALRHLPVILLSARTGEAATADGLATGANDYIVKPFSARELLARVRVQLEIWKSYQRDQARQIAEVTNRAKDEFLAVLGHELRNPLAPILTALELMKMRDPQSSRREREVIERQVHHVVRLVDDLLDVSRITRGKMELDPQEVAVSSVIAKSLEIASPLLEKRTHTVVVDVVPPELTLVGDPFRLAQVMSNLLTNAAKFTEPGGTITIAAQRERDGVVLRVRDTGIGIEASRLPTVFDAFSQGEQAADRAKGGLGLGLTIVKSLVTLHGGRVEAHSAGPGQGTEFIIHLPALIATAAPLLAQATHGEAAGTVPLRVLLVDDNKDAAALLADALRLVGHAVVVAHDGPEALLASSTFEPDVALLDIGLPVMDGYELAERLRADPSSPARFIALSGYGEPRDRVRSKAAGFDVHLVKPVNFEQLRLVLAEKPPRGDST
jgi:signal transduction histidine kinase